MFDVHYADLYDTMYANKDYAGEVAAFTQLFSLAEGEIKNILTVGCGTLKHEAILERQGYHLYCIDQSATMIALAEVRKKELGLTNIKLVQTDMRTFVVPPGSFDLVMAPFNVISYCDGRDDLQKFVQQASVALRAGGLIIFDCWYAPAVRQSPPNDRLSKFKKDEQEVWRFVKAKPDLEHNSADLEIELLQIAADKIIGRSVETHRVHFWDLEEIKNVFATVGLELLHTGRFPQVAEPITADDWNMIVVGQKK